MTRARLKRLAKKGTPSCPPCVCPDSVRSKRRVWPHRNGDRIVRQEERRRGGRPVGQARGRGRSAWSRCRRRPCHVEDGFNHAGSDTPPVPAAASAPPAPARRPSASPSVKSMSWLPMQAEDPVAQPRSYAERRARPPARTSSRLAVRIAGDRRRITSRRLTAATPAIDARAVGEQRTTVPDRRSAPRGSASNAARRPAIFDLVLAQAVARPTNAIEGADERGAPGRPSRPRSAAHEAGPPRRTRNRRRQARRTTAPASTRRRERPEDQVEPQSARATRGAPPTEQGER